MFAGALAFRDWSVSFDPVDKSYPSRVAPFGAPPPIPAYLRQQGWDYTYNPVHSRVQFHVRRAKLHYANAKPEDYLRYGLQWLYGLTRPLLRSGAIRFDVPNVPRYLNPYPRGRHAIDEYGSDRYEEPDLPSFAFDTKEDVYMEMKNGKIGEHPRTFGQYMNREADRYLEVHLAKMAAARAKMNELPVRYYRGGLTIREVSAVLHAYAVEHG